MCHRQKLLRTKRSGITTRACRAEKKPRTRRGKELKETIEFNMDNKTACKYCETRSVIYNHHCEGCRGRLIMSTFPNRELAKVMIEHLYRSVRLDRKQLAEEGRRWAKLTSKERDNNADSGDNRGDSDVGRNYVVVGS